MIKSFSIFYKQARFQVVIVKMMFFTVTMILQMRNYLKRQRQTMRLIYNSDNFILAFICIICITYSFIRYPHSGKRFEDKVFLYQFRCNIKIIHEVLIHFVDQIECLIYLQELENDSKIQNDLKFISIDKNDFFFNYSRFYKQQWIINIWKLVVLNFIQDFLFANILLLFYYIPISVYTMIYFINAILMMIKIQRIERQFQLILLDHVQFGQLKIQLLIFSLMNSRNFYNYWKFNQIMFTWSQFLRQNDPKIKIQLCKSLQFIILEQDDSNFLETIYQNLKYDSINKVIFGIRAICESDQQKNQSNQMKFEQIQILRKYTDQQLQMNILLAMKFLNQSYLKQNIDKISSQNQFQFQTIQNDSLCSNNFFEIMRKRFDLILNRDQNQKNQRTRWEFFLLTHDNKIIIKKLSDQELVIIIKTYSQLYPFKLKRYCNFTYIWYLQVNQIKFKEYFQIIQVLNPRNMKNIIYAQNQNLRIYDIKGQINSKEVLKEYVWKSRKLNQKTLISKLYNNNYKYQYNIKRDRRNLQLMILTFLLESNQLIIIIDWYSNSQTNTHIKESVISNNFSSYYADTLQVFIIIYAIIDYLQECNAQKILEKYFPIVLNGNIDPY
ncbi:unnamed protein product [Paramecium sonneborni]|uniref:Transmembrane protein n=1 Tax=Paramecium sonneborni TaxID=65129 RepID=A0A8S1R0W9_9CILI|nr:unnamed protein product [Paramecium sonneborni]